MLLPLQIFFASAGIALTTYLGYVMIKFWINRSKESDTQASSSYMNQDLAPTAPFITSADREPSHQAAKTQSKSANPSNEFNKLQGQPKENIAPQNLRLVIGDVTAIYKHNNKCFLEDASIQIDEFKARTAENSLFPRPR